MRKPSKPIRIAALLLAIATLSIITAHVSQTATDQLGMIFGLSAGVMDLLCVVWLMLELTD